MPPSETLVMEDTTEVVMDDMAEDQSQGPASVDLQDANSIWTDEFDNLFVEADESGDRSIPRGLSIDQQRDTMLSSRFSGLYTSISSAQWIDQRLALLGNQYFLDGFCGSFVAVLSAGLVLGLFWLVIKKRQSRSNRYDQFTMVSIHCGSDSKPTV